MRIAILALAGTVLSGCSLFNGPGGNFGSSGSQGGCFGCDGQFNIQQAQSIVRPVQTTPIITPQCGSIAQMQHHTLALRGGCHAGTGYNVASSAQNMSGTHGLTHHVDQGFGGYGHNIGAGALGLGTLGAVPALRGRFTPGRSAVPHFYTNLGLNAYDVETEGLGGQLRAGYQATKYFGGELEGSLKINDDDELGGGLDYTAGAFLVSRAPLSKRLALISRVGYYYANLDGGLEEDNIAYGGGAEFALTPKDGIRVDYTRYEGLNADSVALSYARKF